MIVSALLQLVKDSNDARHFRSRDVGATGWPPLGGVEISNLTDFEVQCCRSF
jgi:hypothetical protein